MTSDNWKVGREGPRLLWIDLETTGFDPATGEILEVAAIVTGRHLEVLAEVVSTVCVPRSVLDSMHPEARAMHEASGLLRDLGRGGMGLPNIEARILVMLGRQFSADELIMLAGNSVGQFDRRWLDHHMPGLASLLHHRVVDVSSLREACRFTGMMVGRVEGGKPHRAKADLKAAIGYLRAFRREVQALRKQAILGDAEREAEPQAHDVKKLWEEISAGLVEV